MQSQNLQGRSPWFSHLSGVFSLLCGPKKCHDIENAASLEVAFRSVFPDFADPLPTPQGTFLYGIDFVENHAGRHVIVAIETGGPLPEPPTRGAVTDQCDTCGKDAAQLQADCPRAFQDVQTFLNEVRSGVQECLKQNEKVRKARVARGMGRLTSKPCPI